jgi:hypothetical protein
MEEGLANSCESQRILLGSLNSSENLTVAANPLPDDCVSRYSAIINLPQARKRDANMLKDWISRPDLGGIAFSGDDLCPVGKSVYDDIRSQDLMILNNRAGENDPFTRYLAGPVFHGFERIWRFFKVSPI